MNTLEAKNKKKGFTLILCFSRRWCVAPFFERFEKLKFNKKNCHLLVFDNTDNVLLQQELMQHIQNITKHYLSVRYFKTYRQGGFVVRGQLNNDFYKSKIYPISQMQQDIHNFIFTDVFIQLEDDELPQNPHTLTRLLALLKKKCVAVASGVSAARSPDLLKVGMGVHQIVELQGDRITKRICCSPKFKGVHEVDATGFYCFAAKKKIWVQALNDAKNVASGLPHWAFDTWVTHQVTRRGYKILADFSLWCDHIQTFPNGIYSFNQKDAVIDAYVYIPELNVYSYWQNTAPYGWVIQDDGKNIRRNRKRISTEVLQR